MIRLVTRARLLRDEGGFTVVEMMITITIWIVILLALANIFDTGVRIFTVGNNKVEAVESARVGLAKMEREIRAAYPVNASSPTTRHLFFSANGAATNPPQAMPTATQITFGNELGEEVPTAPKVITCGTPCEYITYKLTADPDGSTAACTAYPCDLRRVNGANSSAAGTPVVENVALNGLTFTYRKSDGTPATTEGEISRVQVSLRIIVGNPATNFQGTQELTTQIDLRNRQ